MQCMNRWAVGWSLLWVLSMGGRVVPVDAGQLVYLATSEDKQITAFDLNPDSGKLVPRFRLETPGNLGPLCFSPDTSYVYAALTGTPDAAAAVATLARAADGSLQLAGTAAITGRTPYIRTNKSGTILLAAHYGTGEVTVYRIRKGICTAELLDRQKTEREAHCIEIDPSGRFVYVPHTEPNKVYQFRLLGDSGKLQPLDPPFAPGPDPDHRYHEPRHYAHHPTLAMGFTSNENGGGISSWKWDAQSGKLTRVQTLGTLPPGYREGSAAADIRITPNGRFAYVSNRDTEKRPAGSAFQDTLAAVAIDGKTGTMKIVGHYPTGHFPRSFCIDVTGRYLFAAGQLSNDLFAYRIDQKTGALVHLATYQTGGVPIWVMCGSVK